MPCRVLYWACNSKGNTVEHSWENLKRVLAWNYPDEDEDNILYSARGYIFGGAGTSGVNSEAVSSV